MQHSEILERFRNPRYAYNSSKQQLTPSRCIHIRVGKLASEGNVVELFVKHNGEKITQARFLAYGGPALIAMADAFCEALEQLHLAELNNFSLHGIQEKLAIENTNIHVVLLLNEALEEIKTKLKKQNTKTLASNVATK